MQVTLRTDESSSEVAHATRMAWDASSDVISHGTSSEPKCRHFTRAGTFSGFSAFPFSGPAL